MQDEQQYIDQFTKKIIQDADLERPSIDFTAMVMAEVSVPVKSPLFSYKPLIPKSTWLLLGFAFIAVIFFVLLGNHGTQSTFNFDRLLPTFELSISPIFTYCICSISLFLTLGIPFLKKHLEQDHFAL